MGRSEKLNQGGDAGRHSPDTCVPAPKATSQAGSAGGVHSPRDVQGAQDKALNSIRPEAPGVPKKK